MISFRHPQRRLLSALLALWLALCAVAVCVAFPEKMAGGSTISALDSASDFAGQDHCTSDVSDHRCDDRRQGEHRSLADLLPLLALFALPFIYLPRRTYVRSLRPRSLPRRRNLRLHLLNCVQLN